MLRRLVLVWAVLSDGLRCHVGQGLRADERHPFGGKLRLRLLENNSDRLEPVWLSIKVAERRLDGKASKLSRVAWDGLLYGRADELLEQVESKRLQRDEAWDWLYQPLKGDPVTSKELKAKAV